MEKLAILLLLLGGSAATWAARLAGGDSADAGGAAVVGADGEPIRVDQIGSDINYPDDSKTVQELRKLAESAARLGGKVEYSSPEFQLFLDTPKQPAPYIETTGSTNQSALDAGYPAGKYQLVTWIVTTQAVPMAVNPEDMNYYYFAWFAADRLPAEATLVNSFISGAIEFKTRRKLHPAALENWHRNGNFGPWLPQNNGEFYL